MKERIKMRPFTDSDWEAFSGCETECPEIGNIVIKDAGEGLIIRDGCNVEIYIDSECAGIAEPTLWRDFKSEEYAAEFCSNLYGYQVFDIRYMKDVYNFNSHVKDAVCKCGADIKWDWCGDRYKIDGRECTVLPLVNKDGELIEIYKCWQCSQILGASHNGVVVNHKILEDIDWEEDINSAR